MILTVSHVSTYSYASPMRGAVQSLRLTPTRFDGQKVIDWQIGVDGGSRGGGFRDGAGDWVEGWSVRGPLQEVVVRVEGKIEVSDLSGMLRGHREVTPPAAYMRVTAPTRADAALTDLAHGAVAGAKSLLDSVYSLSAAVSDAIVYRPGATEAHTTAAEACALGEGVCQDHAHALISVARVLGQPARYVSGYLFADADGNSHEAAHAWAEVWVDDYGWIGFDPANRCCPDDRYIRLGSGFDAQDAAPIRGLALGLGDESLNVEVAINAVQQ